MIIKSLVKFGNSRGFIIPKLFLEMLGDPHPEVFKIEIDNGRIILSPEKLMKKNKKEVAWNLNKKQ